MKYIMFKNQHNYFPIIFCDSLPHIVIAELILNCSEFSKLDLRIASTGFIEADFNKTFGNSLSLGRRSRKIDANIIDTYEYHFGIRPYPKPMPRIDFDDLVYRFQKLADTFGITKSSSFSVKLRIENNNFAKDGKYFLELGTYDIDDKINLELGPFKSMFELTKRFEKMVVFYECCVRCETGVKNGY